MNMFGLMDTSGEAMQAERMRAEVVAANMANAETTRTASGGPYRRQHVVFAANQGDPGFLDSMMRETTTVERFDEIAVPRDCPFLGRPVGEFKGSQGHAPLLLAVHDGDTGKYDINPDPDRPIKAGDRLVMLGEVAQLSELRQRFGAKPD